MDRNLPTERRTSETVKKNLSQIFARCETPGSLASDSGFEFVIGDLKQWCKSQGFKKI